MNTTQSTRDQDLLEGRDLEPGYAAHDSHKLAFLAAAIRAITIPQMSTEDGRKIAVAIESERETFARRVEAAAKEI